VLDQSTQQKTHRIRLNDPDNNNDSQRRMTMSDWQKATMDNFYFSPGDEPDLDDECLVRFDAGSITLKYDDDGEPVVWRGTEIAPGHFKLQSPEVDGNATLHRFPNGPTLIGEWVEDGQRGVWRVDLPSDPV
jgi:hypothetical protein